MKKTISVLMCFCMIISTLVFTQTSASAESYVSGDFKYSFLDNGTAKIVRYTGTATTLEIPNEIDGNKVTYISWWAFNGCNTLKSVTIPETVTSIGCGAFYNCTSLTSVTIPETVTSIEYYAFSGCSSLTSITIPNSVTSVGCSAFDGCESLKIVNTSSLEAWCNIQFEGYNANPLCYSEKLYLNNQLVTDLVIPNTATKIGDYAFYYLKSLKSVTIPEGVTSIGYMAFGNCRSLTSITLPEGVTSIENLAFSRCKKIEYIIIPKTVTRINNFAFSHCNSLKNIYYTGTEKQWNNIKFNINNSFIITANIYYNYNQNQKPVARKTLKTPKIKLTSNKKQIKIKYTKVKNAVGFQVIYTIKNDSKLKTFNTKKSAIKTIKKLKAGRYKIQVRAFSKGKKYYSNWTEINTVKVK